MNKLNLGQRLIYGTDEPFGIGLTDVRRHIYIIGQTGTGKTTLLRNILLQLIHAGHGVALLDPHGDLAEDVLNHYPSRRADDLVYFNPADAEFPIGFNPLANVPPEQRALVTAGLVSAFKSIWHESWGPRLEYILANTIAALLEAQNTSLLGINRMLSNDNYRAWVVRQIKDPFLKSFWTNEFANYEPRFMREAISPIQNKLGQLMLSPLLRNVLGQVRSKVNLRFMMDNRRVLIANLAKGKLGEDPSNLLGALLASQFQHAAMTRADTLEDERHDFYLLIDEFQNFTTDSFAKTLAEARKYRLNLTLVHQYLEQLPRETLAAVFGNVGTIISFRIGHADAKVLADAFGQSFVAEHFFELNHFEVLTRIPDEGATRAPFRGKTHPPVYIRTFRSQKLIYNSREKYSAKRSNVESTLRRWLIS